MCDVLLAAELKLHPSFGDRFFENKYSQICANTKVRNKRELKRISSLLEFVRKYLQFHDHT